MTCKKKPYKSYQHANHVAIQFTINNKKMGHPGLRVYKCDCCGNYHLTSISDMTPEEKEEMRRDRKFIQEESSYWQEYFNKLDE